MSLTARLERFSLPLRHPLVTSTGTIRRRVGFLLGVEAGTETGLGEASPLSGWTEPFGTCVEALSTAQSELTRAGFDAATAAVDAWPATRHAVTLARDDIAAKRADRPLYRHLDAPDRVESVPVNATVGDGSPEETAARAARAVDGGFRCVKVKVGARDVHEDTARLRQVLEAVGGGVELRADANGAWDIETARAAFEAFERLGVAYVEQPLDPADLSGHAALSAAFDVDVALDETLARTPLETVLAAGAADVVVLKPMALGGVGRARRLALDAREAGVTPVVTTTVDAVVARTAAVHLAASLPDPPACGLATGDRLAYDLAPDPTPVSGGQIRVPQSRGLGVTAGEEG